MTDNIIPIVSNTPPPIDDDVDDDYGGGFQGFSSHSNKWDSDDGFGDFSEPPQIDDDLSFSPQKIYVTPENLENITSKDQCECSKMQLNLDVNDHNTFDEENRDEDYGNTEVCPRASAEITVSPSIQNIDQSINNVSENPNNIVETLDDIKLAKSMLQSKIEMSKLNFDLKGLQNHIGITTENKADLNTIESKSIPKNDLHNCAKFEQPDSTISSENDNNVGNEMDTWSNFENVQAAQNGQNVGPQDDIAIDEPTTDSSVSNSVYHTTVPNFSNVTTSYESFTSTGTTEKESGTSTDSCGSQNIEKDSSNNFDANTEANNSVGDDFAEFDHVHFSASKCNNDDLSADSTLKIQSSIVSDQTDEPLDSSSPMEEHDNKAEKSDNADKIEFSDQNFANFSSFDSPLNNASEQFPTESVVATHTTVEAFAEFDADDSNANFAPSFSANFDGLGADGAPFQTTCDDDFGDFGSADTASMSQINEQNNSATLNEKTSEEEDLNFIHQHVEENILDLFKSSLDTISPKGVDNSRDALIRPTDLWTLLKDVDNTLALQFQWNNSLNYQRLLSALGLDTQNVLFSGGKAPYFVPTYFAAGLGLLRPASDDVKLSSSSAPPSEKSLHADVATEWTTETEVPSNRACSPGSGSTGANTAIVTNHFTAASFNLDLLDESISKSTSRRSVSSQDQDRLDPDLLEFAMEAHPDTAPKKVDPLAKILATLKVSSSRKSLEDEEQLSDEAAEVLQQLPDLSYMRSRVLMFPVSQ